jgi:antitoxin VapB
MEQTWAIREFVEHARRQRIAWAKACRGLALVYIIGTTKVVPMTKRIHEPTVAYHAAPAPAPAVRKPAKPVRGPAGPHARIVGSTAPGIRAKLFANGRSQAVRLPKEFRLPGVEVLIRRDGDRVILEAIPDVQRDANGWPVDLWEWLDQFSDDFTEPEPMPAGLLTSESISSFDDPALLSRTSPRKAVRRTTPKQRAP